VHDSTIPPFWCVCVMTCLLYPILRCAMGRRALHHSILPHFPRLFPNRCRVHIAHIKQSRPDSPKFSSNPCTPPLFWSCSDTASVGGYITAILVVMKVWLSMLPHGRPLPRGPGPSKGRCVSVFASEPCTSLARQTKSPGGN